MGSTPHISGTWVGIFSIQRARFSILRFLRAFLAMPEKLQGMLQVAVAVLPREAAFELLHGANIFKQRNVAAIEADEMIVMPARIEQLEVAGGAAKVHALQGRRQLRLSSAQPSSAL